MSSNGGILGYENGAYNVSVQQGEVWQISLIENEHYSNVCHVWYV